MKKRYRLQKRGKFWQYKLATDATFHSTGITGKRDAEDWVICEKLGKVGTDPFLRDFAAGFFLPGSSWITRQHAKGRPFGAVTAKTRQAQLEQYILDKWGRFRLSELSKAAIETWLVGLYLSNQTKNHILYTFRIVLREAEDAGAIMVSPLARVEAMGKAARARDVFTAVELRLLFPMGRLADVWGSPKRGCMFLLLASTGIRAGEMRALSWDRVLWSERAILVDRTVKGGSGGTGEVGPISEKKGGAKIVLLPRRAEAELHLWYDVAAWREPDDFVFPGEIRGRPLGSAAVTHALGPAIRRINKAAAKDKLPPPFVVGDRNLVVHSFRHTYVSALRRLVPEETLRLLTGHHSIEMTDLYDHPRIERELATLQPARAVVDGLLG
jgi:integrase